MNYIEQTHNVKPEHLLTYLDLYEEFTALRAGRHNGLKLVGSFLVEVGDQVCFRSKQLKCVFEALDNEL